MDSLSKNLAFAAVAALAGVLGASIGKLMLQGPGIGPLFYLFVFLYLCAGVLNFGAAMLAASRADLGLYMPIFSCLQLWVNCLTGLIIWQVSARWALPRPRLFDAGFNRCVRQDWKVINSWTAYASVYILILLGVYECSSYDVVQAMALRVRFRKTKLSEGVAVSAFGRSVSALFKVWQQPEASQQEAKAALHTALQQGAEDDAISKRELIDLAMMLMETRERAGFGPSSTLLSWLDSHSMHYQAYVQQDPLLKQQLQGLSVAWSQRPSVLVEEMVSLRDSGSMPITEGA
jgi:hypothetical protein